MTTPYLLPHLIEAAAARDASHPALSARGHMLTYDELVGRSAGLAEMLVARGVRPHDRVGIYMNKRVESGVALYGILMAGAVYVPLDATAPTARLSYIIENCGIEHVVSESQKTDRLDELAQAGTLMRTVLGVKQDETLQPGIPWEDIPRNGKPPSLRITESDLCYILYTSGSTGVPKGIMHTHRSALSWANVAADTYQLKSSDVLSNYAPLHFDLSTLDFFAGARSAAHTVMLPEESLKLGASLLTELEQSRITVFYTVPMALVQLSMLALDPGRLPDIRLVLFGGEPMPIKHLVNLMQVLPNARFFNVYGPTEVNGCTHHEVTVPPDTDGPGIPIGRPYPNVEALVENDSNESALPGDVGELLIRSPTMMRGYWGRDDLNEHAFSYRRTFSGLPDVFHKTGDLVHQDDFGVLHFHGRKDRQIKTRGFRVELDEIEAALVGHPDVLEAATFSVTNNEGTVLIHAAAKLTEGTSGSAADLRRHLSATLPGYAVPSWIDLRDDFPRTATGKIDRKRLAEMAATKDKEAANEHA